VIKVRGLTKRYGGRLVVDDLSFEVNPGEVTGFLGPNGSGKTTTARIILGLTRSDSGLATINGKPYRQLRRPLRELGAMIDAGGVNPTRTAVEHLRWMAVANDIDRSRAEAVLAVVGLDEVAGRKVAGFSLGMRQRLGIAAALIGDPPALLLDEPINGLDPEGIRWIRGLMQSLAAEGRTVFVASHLMSEMALTASALVVIGAGRLIAAESVVDFTERAVSSVRVRSPQLDDLEHALADGGASVWRHDAVLDVMGFTIERIGIVAAGVGATLFELSPQRASLEDAFMQLTCDSAEFASRRVAS
jgi:ABC-2 type transport system ATP-binding protein